MINNILIPGRHHALTTYQFNYLRDLFSSGEALTLEGAKVCIDKDCQLIWAITSGNHANTRRNPISGTRRLAMIELAAEALPASSQGYLIPNMAQKTDFAHYLIEEVRMQSRGLCNMTPENTLVACSTPIVIEQYQALGYQILPIELESSVSESLHAPRPWDVIEQIISSGAAWQDNQMVTANLEPGCRAYYIRYGLADHIIETFNDPLTSDDGDITATREYETYRAAFEDNAFRKVAEFAPYVQPGRIMDVGCATGQTIKLLGEIPELFESDFYGIEAARPLFDICEQRRHNGAFGNSNVFFYQRNIMRSEIFPANTLNTIITMALTHEIESYLGRESLLEFIKRMFDMLATGGVYINYDVVGPKEKDEHVWVNLNMSDGDNPAELYPHLDTAVLQTEFMKSLSSKARFTRFCNDFRHDENEKIDVQYENHDDQQYAVLRYADFCDFLAKKDYTESWQSEMHERFCFWNYDDWASALTEVGFEIHTASKSIQNPWLIKNRFEPAATVFRKDNTGNLIMMPQPDTNIMIIAQKPL